MHNFLWVICNCFLSYKVINLYFLCMLFVLIYIYTHTHTQARWMVEIMKIRQLSLIVFNFDCIYCQNFSLKTKFILGFFFLFILITLVGFTQIICYTCFKLCKKCYKKFVHTKHRKMLSSSFSKLLLNTGKIDSFQKMLFRKWTIF